MAAELAMVTTLEMGGILEVVCTIPASPQPNVEPSAACEGRNLNV